MVLWIILLSATQSVPSMDARTHELVRVGRALRILRRGSLTCEKLKLSVKEMIVMMLTMERIKIYICRRALQNGCWLLVVALMTWNPTMAKDEIGMTSNISRACLMASTFSLKSTYSAGHISFWEVAWIHRERLVVSGYHLWILNRTERNSRFG